MHLIQVNKILLNGETLFNINQVCSDCSAV